jgi:hypothetical protein
VTTTSTAQGFAWSNPSSVQTADNVFATALITGANKTTFLLDAKNWGFQSSNSATGNYIPPDAVINGIEVFVKFRKSNIGNIRDNRVMLLKNGAEAGVNKARSGALWPTVATETKFGSNIDMWGTTWTVADLLNTNFGVRISAKNRGAKDAQAEIDHIRIVVYFNQVFYYSKSTGNLELTTTWGRNTDGTGASPANFTSTGQVFFVQNRSSTSLTSSLTISGTDSKLIVGDGITATELTIPSAYTLSSIVDVAANSSLVINSATHPTLGTIADNTTVTYGAAGNQSVQDGTYYNLNLSGSGIKTLQNSIAGFSSVNNVLNVGAGNTFQNSGDAVQVYGIANGIVNNGTATGSGTYVYSLQDVSTTKSGN